MDTRVSVDQEPGTVPDIHLDPSVWDTLYAVGAEILETRVGPYQENGQERQWPGVVHPCEIDDMVMAALAAERMMIEATKDPVRAREADPMSAAVGWYQRVIELATDKLAEIARDSRRR